MSTSGWMNLLFLVGILLSAFLFTYTPYQMLAWSIALYAEEQDRLLAAGPLFLAFCSILAGLRWLCLFSFSFFEYRRRSGQGYDFTSTPLVSILVPAFNEGETIARALESLQRLDYPRFEIVVIDDGSTDDTFQRALPYAGDHDRCSIRVYSKPNGGKWSALNQAFRHSTGELILCVDADSDLEPRALRYLVARISEPGVSAVSGQVRVRNRSRLVTNLQTLEYLICNGALRTSQSRFKSVLVVPGPIGLYRRTVLEEVYLNYGSEHDCSRPGHVVGPYEPDTFAEDFDLSLAVLYLGGNVVYEPLAISRTKAPDWVFPLLNQRYRWARGSLQVLAKYIRRLRRDPRTRVGRVFLWISATYFFYLTIQPAVFLAGLGFFLLMLINGVSLWLPLLFLLVFQMITLVASILYIRMHREDMRLLRLIPIYDIYQGFLVNCGWAIAIIDEVRGVRMRW